MAQRILQTLFRLSIIVFLAGGGAIVVGQTVGLILGDAHWMIKVQHELQPPTAIAASICGILAFILFYRKPSEESDIAVEEAPTDQTAAA